MVVSVLDMLASGFLDSVCMDVHVFVASLHQSTMSSTFQVLSLVVSLLLRTGRGAPCGQRATKPAMPLVLALLRCHIRS